MHTYTTAELGKIIKYSKKLGETEENLAIFHYYLTYAYCILYNIVKINNQQIFQSIIKVGA